MKGWGHGVRELKGAFLFPTNTFGKEGGNVEGWGGGRCKNYFWCSIKLLSGAKFSISNKLNEGSLQHTN